MKRNIHILFAWIGHTDIYGSKGDVKKTGPGPIAQAVDRGDFTHVVLLSNYPATTPKSPSKASTPFFRRDAEAYCVWLKARQSSLKIDLVDAQLSRPVALNEIYPKAKAAVQRARSTYGEEAQLSFHLSPGTPEMAAAWVLLTGLFKAELLESSQKHGVGPVPVPFDIAVEYVPDVVKSFQDDLAERLQSLPPETPEWKEIIHRCPAMRVAVMEARAAAHHELPVLILGKTGTGKELFARAIHMESKRRNKPFRPINCGAIAETLFESELFGHERGSFTGADRLKVGVFEEATGGSVFLDEIGELLPDCQVKLLRALQEKKVRRVGSAVEIPVDVRVIAATNRNLIREVSEGRFREDLYYRLAVDLIHIPPLCEREGDLALLIDYFLGRASQATGSKKILSAGARQLLLCHSWPGNVRELENTLLRACVKSSGPTIEKKDIDRALAQSPASLKEQDSFANRSLGGDFSLDELQRELDRHYIGLALRNCKTQKQAAKKLGFQNTVTLKNRAKACGLDFDTAFSGDEG